MKIYFLRHGQADWPDWKKPDDERPLTSEGRSELQRVSTLLVRLEVKPDLILASPLPRAFQTADIVASHLKVSVGEEKSLAPGFRLPQLRQLLGKHPELNLMLVGHEPDLSKTIGALTGASLKFRKAATALVDLHQKKGKLLWLIPPEAAAK